MHFINRNLFIVVDELNGIIVEHEEASKIVNVGISNVDIVDVVVLSRKENDVEIIIVDCYIGLVFGVMVDVN